MIVQLEFFFNYLLFTRQFMKSLGYVIIAIYADYEDSKSEGIYLLFP